MNGEIREGGTAVLAESSGLPKQKRKVPESWRLILAGIVDEQARVTERCAVGSSSDSRIGKLPRCADYGAFRPRFRLVAAFPTRMRSLAAP